MLIVVLQKKLFKRRFKTCLERACGKTLFSENIGCGKIILPRKNSVTDYELRENPSKHFLFFFRIRVINYFRRRHLQRLQPCKCL